MALDDPKANLIENIRKDIDAGQRVQERIQFYFLTLTFTLLALAIESFEPGPNKASSILELISWLALLVSGLCGLYRMRSLVNFYKISIKQNTTRLDLECAEEEKRDGNNILTIPKLGRSVSIDSAIEQFRNAIDVFDEKREALEDHLKPFIWIHNFGLFSGITLLAIARSYDPLLDLL